MDGAPEKIANVPVYASSDLSKPKEPEQDMAKILLSRSHLLNSVNWSELHLAITSLRQLIKYNPTIVQVKLTNPLIVSAASSLRSGLARNAILCIKETVSLQLSKPEPIIHAFVPILLSRIAGNEKFLKTLAFDTLTLLVSNYKGRVLLSTLFQSMDDHRLRQHVSCCCC